jgi:hypothetical protein
VTTSESGLEFDYTYTSDDAVNASWLYGRSARRRTLLIVGAVALFALAIWFVTSIPFAFGFFTAALAWGLLSVSRLWMRLMIRLSPAVRVGARISIAVTPDGITYRTDGLSGEIQWQAVTKVLEDNRAIVLLQRKVPLLSLAKRVFVSPATEETFKDLVRSRAPHASWQA